MAEPSTASVFRRSMANRDNELVISGIARLWPGRSARNRWMTDSAGRMSNSIPPERKQVLSPGCRRSTMYATGLPNSSNTIPSMALASPRWTGHGVPDPRRPESLYLMCYDSDPAHIASTALPMRELQAALQHNIEAQRVIALADSCHSAGITEAGVRAVGVENAVNQSFAQLWKTRPGRAIFTSSEG
jgi:hypothetical protein